MFGFLYVLLLDSSAMPVFLAHTCRHVSAYGLFGRRAHAPLSMWVHSYSTVRYTTNAACSWVLETFVCMLVIAFAVILSPFPLPTHPPLLHWDPTSPVSSFPGHDHWGGFVTHNNMMTISTPPVTKPPWYAAIPDLLWIPCACLTYKYEDDASKIPPNPVRAHICGLDLSHLLC